MGKIIKHMKPYWKSVIIIFLLLIVQAWCDLSLPQYTSNIIDIGIQNSGVEHVLPEKITAEEFNTAQLFMTTDETTEWQACYEQNDDIYSLVVDNEKDLEELDERFSIPLILNYQLSAMQEDACKQQIAAQSGMDASAFDNMTILQIGESMGIPLEVFTRESEDEDGNLVEVAYVDIRPMFKVMLETGQMSQEMILSMRSQVEEMIDTMGSQLVQSTGVAYAIQCNKDAGLNMETIQTDYLWLSGLKMLAVALLMGIISVLVGFFASKVGAGIGMRLRSNIFKNVVGFSNAEMDKFSTASLITRSTNDIQQIQMVITMMLRMVLYAPILGIGGIIKVIETGAGMGWVIILAVLFILALVGLLMTIAMPKFKLMQTLVDHVNLVSREILTGLSVIRAFGREREEEKRFDKANRKLTGTMLFTNRTMNFMMPCMMMVMYGLTLLIVWVASHKINDGVMQVGAMTAFITYAMQIVMSFLMLTAMSIILPRAGVAAERIDEVLRTHSSVEDPLHPEKVEESTGVIAFNHVSFRYPGANEDVLSDIDFVAEPGKTTAIIGSTGCGKSTLVNLIPRLYDVTSGSVTLDGQDIRNIKMSDLRTHIGFVPQKGVLFSGTIASNLRFGKRDASDADIKEAAEIAQALEFIEEKPNTFDSRIAQGGSNVSGGQKQRLAIARAIAKNPKIFIFDDSFSALDLKTDAKLRKELDCKVSDSTVIIVAQRISTIIHADQILVLDDGKIVGKGKHEELLKNCDVYQQIARSQLSAKELGIEGKEA